MRALIPFWRNTRKAIFVTSCTNDPRQRVTLREKRLIGVGRGRLAAQQICKVSTFPHACSLSLLVTSALLVVTKSY